MWLVLGLGNPGARYEDTRHNAGFLVVDELARRWSLPGLRPQLGAATCRGEIAGHAVILAQPQGYMNCSGAPAGALQRFYKVPTERVVVVHDDLDLERGAVRVKRGGGHGGHNGLRDLSDHLGVEFLRVRIGISRPPAGWDAADYVLSRWSDDERTALPEWVRQAADAVELLLAEGVNAAMNRHNVRPKRSRVGSAEDPSGEPSGEPSGGPAGLPGGKLARLVLGGPVPANP